jgi:RNA polymerase sigma-70 factor (ECF subfamily)
MRGDLKMTITTSETAQDELMTLAPSADDDLEAAFKAYWSRICATLYRLVGDWDEAEDLALEVFYRLHHRPPRHRDRLGSWLYRVATHIGLNALRARRRRREYEESAGIHQLQRTDPVDPAEQVERSERRARVRHTLALMRPRRAQILILRHSGLSYAEIAASLGIAPGSVGTLLARAEKDFGRRYRALEEDHETR